jgi:hypothetical protein
MRKFITRMIMILLGAGLAGAIITDRGIATRGLTVHTDVEHPEKATQTDLSQRPPDRRSGLPIRSVRNLVTELGAISRLGLDLDWSAAK